MKFINIVSAIAALVAPMSVIAKSKDYARHIELSLLFYEAQRSGKLPENNRIFWRHDSLLDAGADNNVDLTGGYYDAGDNVKFNFPGAASMTLLAWGGIDYADGYKQAGQWDYLLDAVRWGADYFMKCHTGKNELYVQVGNGSTDHGYWYPPEYINYKTPSYKITASAPGTEVAAETAAFLAAASILFKDEDSSYAAKCLKHSKEIYDFADTYRGDYIKAVPDAQGFYSTWSGYNDELVWGAAWLLRATGDNTYLEKYNKIANAVYGDQDTKRYGGNTGPISWDDKRPGAYILIAIVTGDEKRMQEAYAYCDAILTQPRTPGGLWYDANLSKWASNRYASNAASMLGMFANYLPKSDPKRAKYIEFVESQTNYILGDNPADVNYVVGAEANSPIAVHHRGASGTYDSQDTNAKPSWNIFTLWGALAGGPGKDDSYTDSRKNYEMNEVALDYNAAFQMNLALLVKEGKNVKDTGKILEFDRAFPKKADTPDISVNVTKNSIEISTGSGMLCSAWCIEITTDYEFENFHDCIVYKKEAPNYIICNRRESNFLDGKGTPQVIKYQGKQSSASELKIDESVVMCDGWHAPQSAQTPKYKPENGRRYKVTGTGGPSNTTPLFEQTKCWPGFLCEGGAVTPTTTTIKKTTTTTKKTTATSESDDCFAKAMGYKCCNDSEVAYTDSDGNWGVVNGEWCGIGGSGAVTKQCGDYPCCNSCDVTYQDADGDWGVENNGWCKIDKDICGEPSSALPLICTGYEMGYRCCNHCNIIYEDKTGPWGVENNDWCGILRQCITG